MALIHLKEGVVIGEMKPQLLDALLTIGRVFDKFNYTLVITSLSDGKHMGNGSGNSLHPRGYAADLRSRDMRVADVGIVRNEMSRALGPAYQVVLEADHIHLEYDPQRDGGLTLP